MSTLEPRTLVEALDETPRSVTGLSRRLDADEEMVEAALHEAQEEGLVVDWGGIWATTWRAKLELSRRFFDRWIPMSIAAGTGLAAFAVATNGPVQTPGWAVPALVALAVVSLAATLYGVRRTED